MKIPCRVIVSGAPYAAHNPVWAMEAVFRGQSIPHEGQTFDIPYLPSDIYLRAFVVRITHVERYLENRVMKERLVATLDVTESAGKFENALKFAEWTHLFVPHMEKQGFKLTELRGG